MAGTGSDSGTGRESPKVKTLGMDTERYCPTCDTSYPASIVRCPADSTALIELAAQQDNLIGLELDGRFTIKERLGDGGMGAAYLAVQHSIGREVAVKVIHAHLSSDRMVAKRFLRETKLASQLSHPNTVTVLDFGQTPDRRLFMVMELVRGETLAAMLDREGAQSPDRTVRIALQIVEALESAHKKGIIHRDLKPSNIMIEAGRPGRDFVKVLDFGLAKSLRGDDTTTVTVSNAIMGTPQYIPPELATGKPADGRSDLYSLGAVLYEMLTGAPPFSGPTVETVVYSHVHAAPDPLPAELPSELRLVVMRLLEKEPDARFQSAQELREVLVGLRDGVELPSDSITIPRLRASQLDRAESREALAATLEPSGQLAAALPADPTRPMRERTTDASESEALLDVSVGGDQSGRAKVLYWVVPTLVAAAALLLVVMGDDGDRQSDSASAVADSEPRGQTTSDTPGRASPDAAEAKADPAAAVTPTKGAEPDAGAAVGDDMVTAKLDSRPRGARVVIGNRLLCDKTPCTVELERAELPAMVEFQRQSYRRLKVRLKKTTGNEIKSTVKLRRVRGRSAPTDKPPTTGSDDEPF